ncbi:MAG: hypothetical protein NHF88_00660 [Candidatus Shikimatogenerans bostrichidophilus]|nr:MAG: hypothetical protein NHF88_00660 [Candidatus Shikimatogenerans bostrichidophilus]
MTYILNIYQRKQYIYSNITYNSKIFLNFPKNYNNLNYSIFKIIKNKKIDLNILNAVSIYLSPDKSHTISRNILSAAKGFCLGLNIKLIVLTSILLFLIKYKKILINKNKIYFLILINKNNYLIFKYSLKLNNFIYYNKINNLSILKIKKNYKYFIKNNYKNKKYISNKYIYYYKINYKYIIKLSYLFYLKKKFILNINNFIPSLYI